MNFLLDTHTFIWMMSSPEKLSSNAKDAILDESNDLALLKIETSHIWQLESLPHIHKDPFDRLLVCQAQCENLTLITRDGHMQRYDVSTLW